MCVLATGNSMNPSGEVLLAVPGGNRRSSLFSGEAQVGCSESVKRRRISYHRVLEYYIKQ